MGPRQIWHQTQGWFAHRESCCGRGYPKITGKCQLEPRADCGTVNRCQGDDVRIVMEPSEAALERRNAFVQLTWRERGETHQ
jgi:hypothetical protein